MKKAIITVLGHDRPGIIAAVSKVLFQQDCNIENVSQTILQTEFSGLFLVALPPGGTITKIRKGLRDALAADGFHVVVTPLNPKNGTDASVPSEPFIITTKGPDRKGLVAAITEIIAGYGANVTNLQAVFKGGADPNNNRMIYEVDIPEHIDQKSLVKDLRQKATQLDLTISIQHRRIFEVLNRI